jgi:hypothetical protein
MLSRRSEQVYKILAKANNSMDGVRQEVGPVKSCVESACKMREKERFRAVYYGDRAKNVLKLLYIILGSWETYWLLLELANIFFS